VSRHYEVALHVFDRETPTDAVDLLDVGVENGGSLEVWRDALPEGSTVLGMDVDPRCADLGLDVITCDVTDAATVKDALRGRWFDVIVDSTGTMSPWTWAFLRAGGRLIFEGYDPGAVQDLVRDVAADAPSWLPVEEIMRVSVFQHVVVIEKRHPRVLPYIEIMVGNFADVTGERDLIESGVKRVLVD
jgi:hypothetical protein